LGDCVHIFLQNPWHFNTTKRKKKRREGKKSKIKGEIDKGNNKAVSAFSFPSYYTTPSSKSTSFLSVAIFIISSLL